MLKFIFGRPGSGKTKYMIEEIKRAVDLGKRTYFLVPEQQVFITEAMLADLPPSSALCFEVVSFSRLCNIVFSSLGGLTNSAVSGGMRQLIMWQTVRELLPLMKQYGTVKADSSLSQMMLSTVDELICCGISAEDCERAAESCSDEALSGKLHDVALIYANFHRILSERVDEGAVAAETKHSHALELLRQSRLFEDSVIFVDSFTSFTGEELALLEELALRAEDFYISFTADSLSRIMPHTEGVRDTVNHFIRFAKENALEYTPVTMSAERKPAPLIALERGLWDFSLTPDTVTPFEEDELSCIEAYVCRNEYEETTLAALKLLQAHKSGTSFSEMALIMRDTESRKGIIEAAFEKMGIPYFISERTDLSTTAAARLVLSALRCVVYNFRAVDVLTLLKTGLCGVDPADADLFEDYCYTWSISGNKFAEDSWSMNPDGYTADAPHGRSREILLAANRVRAQLIPPLITLRARLVAAEKSVSESCRALYSYLEEIKLSESLGSLAELELSLGNLRQSGELIRIYDSIVTVISDLAVTLADAPTTSEELISAMEIMLRGSDVGSVPAVGEYVTVGSASTLRVENIKLAVVIGLCEGEFPGSFADSGIFSENDKKTLSDTLSISLSSRESRITSDELFYAYRAMTKPSEALIVTTVSTHIGGGSVSPSTAWSRLFFLFPKLKKYPFDLSLVKKIAEAMTLGDDYLDSVVIESDKATEEDSEDVTVIDPLRIQMLFGDKIYLSQTKISTFAGCPYKYWCRYVLELRERQISAVSYNNSGTIVHYVLEKFIEEVKEEDGSLRRPDDDTVVRLVDGYVDQYARGIGCPLTPSMMFTFSRLRDLALIMVKSVLDEFADSDFKVLSQELRISERQEGALKPLEIKIDEESESSPKVVLGGIIDRVDYYDGDGRRYLRVVDYKTGSHPFSLEGIETGDDVQLPAYLFTAALDENREVIGGEKEIFPASALFLSANESGGRVSPERSGFILDDIDVLRAASGELDKSILAGIVVDKGTGTVSKGNAVSEEDIKRIDTDLRRSIAETGRSIFAGRAPRTPSISACKYCFLRSTCPVAAKKTDF